MDSIPFQKRNGVSRRSIVKAIQSLQQRIFEHEDKLNRAPDTPPAASWRHEAEVLQRRIQELEQHLL